MQTKWHLLASLFFLFLYPVLGNYVFVCMASSILIDIDAIFLVIRQRAFSLKKIKYLVDNVHKIYAKNPKTAFKDIFYLFHTLEFNALLLILSIWFPILGFIGLGFLFHIFFDVLHHHLGKMPVLRWLFLTEFLRVNLKKQIKNTE
jgi:uncharacterized membrane protein